MKILNKLLILIFIACNLVIVVFGTRFFVADLYDSSAEKAVSKRQISEGISFSQNAVKLNPFEPSYYKTQAELLLYAAAMDQQKSEEYKTLSIDLLNVALELNPINLATLRNTLPVYFYLGVFDLTKPVSASNLDPRYLNTFLTKSKSLTAYVPTDLGVLVNVASYYKKFGFTSDYELLRNEIKSLRPDVLEWHPELN